MLVRIIIHLNSINNAFTEISERQSFIFNWLTHSNGEYIDTRKIKSLTIENINTKDNSVFIPGTFTKTIFQI